jgi:hypothetical protein
VTAFDSEQALETFIRQRLNLPPNLAQKIATPQKIAPSMQNGWNVAAVGLWVWQDGLSYGHFEGEITDPGGATLVANTLLFTLPFVPATRQYFSVFDNNGTVKIGVVNVNGDVKVGDNGPAFRALSTPNLGHVSFPLF